MVTRTAIVADGGRDHRSAGRPSLPNPFDDRPSRLKTKAAITYSFLVAANIAAWVWALVAFADRPVLLGTAFLAYMFGLRHALARRRARFRRLGRL